MDCWAGRVCMMGGSCIWFLQGRAAIVRVSVNAKRISLSFGSFCKKCPIVRLRWLYLEMSADASMWPYCESKTAEC